MSRFILFGKRIELRYILESRNGQHYSGTDRLIIASNSLPLSTWSCLFAIDFALARPTRWGRLTSLVRLARWYGHQSAKWTLAVHRLYSLHCPVSGRPRWSASDHRQHRSSMSSLSVSTLSISRIQTLLWSEVFGRTSPLQRSKDPFSDTKGKSGQTNRIQASIATYNYHQRCIWKRINAVRVDIFRPERHFAVVFFLLDRKPALYIMWPLSLSHEIHLNACQWMPFMAFRSYDATPHAIIRSSQLGKSLTPSRFKFRDPPVLLMRSGS